MLKLSLPSSDLQATSVLLALSQESTRQVGEQFVTDASFQDLATPLFIIGPDTTVQGTYEMKVSYDVSSDAVGATLETISTALTAFSPESEVLNDLTREGVNDAATFIDSSVSNVLGQSLTERGYFDHTIDDWMQGGPAIVTVYMPRHAVRRIAAISASQIQRIGQWSISFDLPRYSLFIAASDCSYGSNGLDCDSVPAGLEDRADRLAGLTSGLTAEQILNYSLAENVTISSRLRNESWHAQALTALNAAVEDDAAPDDLPAAADAYCRQTLSFANASGLNAIDAHIVVWSAMHMADVSLAARDAVLGNQACGRTSDIITRMRLD